MASPIPFLAAKRTAEGASAGILGAGLDLTESCRSGTRAAPRHIRAASYGLESYSPILERDLEDLSVADWGDVEVDGMAIVTALDTICERFADVLQAGFGILLGGEHTIALAGFRAARRVYPDAALVQFDAHLDIRQEYEGAALTHATWVHHAAEEFGYDSIVQLGIRSGTREEFVRAERCLYSSAGLDIPPPILEALAGRPVYLSVDVDVLDPGTAPGTGCPEPGGVTFRELAMSLYALRSLRVIGADVTEVLPETDPAHVTALAAAKIVRELILMFA
jgi:agmatinase